MQCMTLCLRKLSKWNAMYWLLLFRNENMSKWWKKHIDMLKILKKANPQQRKVLLQTCEKGLICCLCECIKDVLLGNAKISKAKHTMYWQNTRCSTKVGGSKDEDRLETKLTCTEGRFLASTVGTSSCDRWWFDQ